jgi:hypothetical protein
LIWLRSLLTVRGYDKTESIGIEPGLIDKHLPQLSGVHTNKSRVIQRVTCSTLQRKELRKLQSVEVKPGIVEFHLLRILGKDETKRTKMKSQSNVIMSWLCSPRSNKACRALTRSQGWFGSASYSLRQSVIKRKSREKGKKGKMLSVAFHGSGLVSAAPGLKETGKQSQVSVERAARNSQAKDKEGERGKRNTKDCSRKRPPSCSPRS